ncbi:hypothetical protein FCR2A7T_06770 [Flavobacterium cauense R2A-7]|uniref:Uncharacterized protein n=1 Tax=Flavobacterium cauense R2A-7 TaxID=1341154 RepID=V6S4B2_9FLAO|nr:hypothetical protein [Flavobacterium cauense]ESU21249.1 hypothetical protein FCR2A7T_06770 [Flavobacterium cauense R2A-7]KGO79303.1 hypothetical protein Q762_14520 [Flavobacterium cauense R2A-7]TWI07385.1 hypothetical protein IP98_02960 [Flavobacterium cauense R2A-7]
MKRIILIVFLITFSKIYSQKIEKKIGAYKITEVGYSFDNENEKRKISKSEFYYNDFGKILEKITYGRHHYNKLNIIGRIEQFYYNKDKLELSKSYSSSCKTCDYYQLYTKYIYDENNVLIKENSYYSENDSLFMTISYVVKPNLKETHFSESTFYQKIYDSQNRIIQLNQIFEDTKKIRWQYLYEYIDSCKIGNFQTYYGDGRENYKQEIECFDSQNRIISKEIIDGSKTKILYLYSKEGLLKEIKEYQSFSDREYKLKYILKFKIKGKTAKLNGEILSKINTELIGE